MIWAMRLSLTYNGMQLDAVGDFENEFLIKQ